MNVQDILVYLIVAAAVAYLVRTYWLSSKGKKGCGCAGGGCGAGKKVVGRASLDPQSGLIQISMLPHSNGSRKKPKEQPRPPSTTLR